MKNVSVNFIPVPKEIKVAIVTGNDVYLGISRELTIEEAEFIKKEFEEME